MAAAYCAGGERRERQCRPRRQSSTTSSRRELQVLELTREGLSNAEIGERLALSAMTAKNHVQNICNKLGVRTRGQAVAEALRLGLIPPGRIET